MKKVRTFTDEDNAIWPSVSGWRCGEYTAPSWRSSCELSSRGTLAVLELSRTRGCDKKGRVLLFIDASPKRRQANGEHSHLSSSFSPRIYEQSLRSYLPGTTYTDDHSVETELIDTRLLLHCSTEQTTFIWRM